MPADFIVATTDWPPDVGGMSEYAVGLVEGLRAGGARVDVRRAPRQGSPMGRALRLLPGLALDRARSRNARLLALQWSPAGVAAWALGRLSGLPYEVVTYGLDVLEPQRSPRARQWLGRVLGAADQVWTISRYTRDCLTPLGVDADRIGLLPPGVNASRFERPEPERVAALAVRLGVARSRVLLSVGRLVRRKGHDLVIRALRELPDDVRYLVVGDGPERARLEAEVIAAGVADRVVFAGALPDADLAASFALATLFAMPTREIAEAGDVEGFGIVYLEANAAGLPVVAARSGGTVDAVLDGRTGLVVPPDDVGALVSALRRLLDDPSLAARLADQGRERARRDFAWRTIAARLHREVPATGATAARLACEREA